jgi:hypothetical protein
LKEPINAPLGGKRNIIPTLLTETGMVNRVKTVFGKQKLCISSGREVGWGIRGLPEKSPLRE